MKFSIGMLSIFFLLLYGNQGITQEAPAEIVQDEVIIGAPPSEEDMPLAFERPAPAPPPGTFVFISSEFEIGDKVVKGAPYSAEAVTERVQTLGDGNRIVQKSNSRIFRDSEGRTRREQEFGAIGPWAAAGEVRRNVFINDPVAKVHYILEAEGQIARKIKTLKSKMRHPLPPPMESGRGNENEDFFVEAAPGPEVGFKNVYKFYSNEADTRKESLGTQMMEGVRVEGTRTTTTIPAQQMGNERAIEIVSEKWYSPELQVKIMSRHSDPRFGETTYKLVNVNRNEPDASLFQVPSGYKVVEDHSPKHELVIEKKLKDKKPE